MKSFWFTVVLFVSSIAASNGQAFFIENKGQWNQEVKYMARLQGALIYLTSDGYSVVQYDRETWSDWMEKHAHQPSKLQKYLNKDDKTLHFHHYKVHFKGSKEPVIQTGEYQPFHYNYFIGNDPATHATGVRSFQQVTYKGIYPNVDVEFLLGPNGFKYNLHVFPGADITQVKMWVEGAEEITSENGDIIIHTSLEDVRETIPVSMVINGDVSLEKEVHFTLDGETIGFQAGEWNKAEYVIIDPVVVFSTYSGSTADNFGFTATYDSSGNFYAGGITSAPDEFFNRNGRYPATVGAFDQTYNGGGFISEYGDFPCDITLSKYSGDGSELIYATYLGGGHNEYPHSIIVDPQGQLIVFGTTFSSNYPTTFNAFQRTLSGNSDIIVTKFSKDGSQLIGSTYIGGQESDGLNLRQPLNYFYADDFRGEVNVNDQGEPYVVSCTYSSDFPVTPGCYQSTRKGDQEGVVFKMSADLTLMVWGTFLGGREADALYSLDFDRHGNVFVSGGTISRDFPGTDKGKYPQYFGGISDGVIAVLSPDGSSLVSATYWGTNVYDQIMSLEIDDADKVYVVGQSQGDIPVIGSVYRNPNSGQFITRFSHDLKEIDFSMVFGSGDGLPDITINAFMVDRCRKIFVSGWGGENSTKNFSSTRNLPVTRDAAQRNTDGSDFYLFVLAKNAEALLYATYYGGNQTGDHVDGGTSRFDKEGVVYQSVCASCPDISGQTISDFPTTPGSYAPINRSPRCSNAAFKIAFGNLNRTPLVPDTIIEVRAFETLDFDYVITDLDGDTMDIIFEPEDAIADNLINFDPNAMAIGKLTRTFTIKPDCDDVTDSYLKIQVNVTDRGCPGSKDSIGYIKIKVLPPPVIDPPETLCLLFEEDGVEINWTDVEESEFFEAVLLYKVHPNGSEEVLQTRTSTSGGKYIDKDVNEPRSNNYTYYLRVRNLCGELGPSSIPVSTVKESESPIATTQLLTATVVENKNVLVRWLHSTEEDFGSYEVYRFNNFTDKEDPEYVGTLYELLDTFFIDENVNVQEISYCYVIVVRDRCGHVSKFSNKACTIVLTGSSIPFAHNLWWNEYSDWDYGVQEYRISRCVDTGSLRDYAGTGPDILYYHDDTLNYDWGGYWYEVLALEKAGFVESSRSNRIYLIQPPLLHVPNAFTPNKDGLNEEWGIVPVFVKTYHLQVYNRWGEKVYESTEKKVLWDGFYKEEQMANNVYIYTITYTGWDRSVQHVKGTVTVVK